MTVFGNYARYYDLLYRDIGSARLEAQTLTVQAFTLKLVPDQI